MSEFISNIFGFTCCCGFPVIVGLIIFFVVRRKKNAKNTEGNESIIGTWVSSLYNGNGTTPWMMHKFDNEGNWSYTDDDGVAKMMEYTIVGNKIILNSIPSIKMKFKIIGDKLNMDGSEYRRANQDEENHLNRIIYKYLTE